MNSRDKGKRGETWKDVVGYEGYYIVSDLGRVKSLPRSGTSGKVIKPYHNKHNGYMYVHLSKNNHSVSKRLHVLVARAFLDYNANGFDSSQVVDHLDGNKTNNSIDNLDICTQRENDRRAREKKKQRYYSVPVINLDTLIEYPSYTEAAKSIDGANGEMVARVCRGERSHYKGHRFAKLEDYRNGTIPEFKGKHKRKESYSLWR